MNCFLTISLCVLAALALTSNAASIPDGPAATSTSRISEDAASLATATSEGANSESLGADKLNRPKRTLGVDKNVKKEYEIKTKHGGSIKLSKSITYNDGGGLTMLPALIDSIGANRRKLIYALRGYPYCDDCGTGASSNENNESVGGNAEASAAAQTPAEGWGQIGGIGGANAEASGQAQTTGGTEGCGSSCWGSTTGGSSQASGQASSQAEAGAAASSQASAQSSSQAQAESIGCGVGGCGGGTSGGSSQASAQANAQASSQAEGSAVTSSQASAQSSSQAQAGSPGCGVGGCGGGIIDGTSTGCGGYGCESDGMTTGCGGYGCGAGVIEVNNQAAVQDIGQIGDHVKAGSQILAGGIGGWEGPHAVGEWTDGCGGGYTGCAGTGCICSHMMPVLLTPANPHNRFYAQHPLRDFLFSHRIRERLGLKLRPLLRSHYHN